LLDLGWDRDDKPARSECRAEARFFREETLARGTGGEVLFNLLTFRGTEHLIDMRGNQVLLNLAVHNLVPAFAGDAEASPAGFVSPRSRA